MRKWLIKKLGGYATVDDAFAAVPTNEKAFYIEELGGYPTVDAALFAVRDMDVATKHKVLTAAVKRLFNTIDEEDILKMHDTAHWSWQGKPLRENEVQLLKSEAQQFVTSRLYEVLQKELKYHSNKKMFIHSVNELDMIAGKLLVYYIDIIATRLKRMQ